jgi:hypothetical protein
MPTNPLGSGVSRYIDDRDKQLAAVVFQFGKPPLDSELNLLSFMDLEARAESIRARYPSGWVMDEQNPREDFVTNQDYSNLFFFGRNSTGEVRNLTWANVNGWMIPVSGTRTGAPPLAPDNVDTWNKILLNPPSTSTGGNRAEFIFLEVWQARIDVDPAPPGVAPGKPQRGFIWRFGNVEGGFSFLPDDLVDPNLNIETTKRVQLQYRIRVVADINIAQYPEGFDPTLVFAQGALIAPSAVAFQNMRQQLGDPGLWRAGTGDPSTFGTVDGYVYSIPICVTFRRNSAGFSDIGNIAGAFNRNNVATARSQATIYTNSIFLPVNITDTDVQFTLTSITGTVFSTITSFGEAYFRIGDEIIRVNNITQTGPISFVITIDRGQLQTTIRSHLSGTELIEYTVRPDGLYADQVSSTDILDLRHGVSDGFDYASLLKTNLTELLKGNLRTTWKRYGSTNAAGPVILYGDRITDSSIFVGGLTRLDGPNGNRRLYSDSVTTERVTVPVSVPTNTTALLSVIQVPVPPYSMTVQWQTAAPGHPAGTRLNGLVPFWFNGDQIRILKSDFLVGLPAGDADQVRFVLPAEDPDAVIIHFEGMTTDPNGAPVTITTCPTTTRTNLVLAGDSILKDGQGIIVTLDGSGNLLITLNSGAAGTPFTEFADAVQGSADPNFVSKIKMQIQFGVVYGAGRGLSHKPDYIHTIQYRGDPLNSSKVMLRPGIADKNRMIPTFLGDSPYIQTGKNRSLARTSEVMIDPGSKSLYVAPYRNVLIPQLLCRDGSLLNWYFPGPVNQGAMPTLSQDGSTTVHPVVDPLSLFYTGAITRYVEVTFEYLPRPGLHHIPIVPITNATFPSGINFLLMSKEGPFGPNDTSDWNRNLVSYPTTAGYYIVTPTVSEVYGTSSGSFSAFGRKYSNSSLRAVNGGPFRGIQFPPFYGPARITGVYKRNTTGAPPFPVLPTASPFDLNRHFVGGPGTDVNLLHDDFDGPTVLLNVDTNGDVTFILNADALDLTKAPSGTTFDNSEFLVECTLFGFDRGFLQTNGRLLVVRNGGLPIAIDTFTDNFDNVVGFITPAPLSVNATNNELTAYYSHAPYQGDVFGSQNAYSDDPYRLGPLTISEANSIHNNPPGPVNSLAFPNKSGYEILSAITFTTSLGTGRLSGSNPIPLLNTTEAPGNPPDFEETLLDYARRFTYNRVGFEDWNTPKFPVSDSSFASRPALVRGAISEIFDRDLHPEFSGCTVQLPLGIYFRDKDFVGKHLYQTRSASDVGAIPVGVLKFTPYEAAENPSAPGLSTWEGTEFVCGNSSNTAGVGGESIIRVDGTSNVSDVTRFKTTRGGAGFSASDPWPGGAISAKIQKSKPNANVGSTLSGIAYLVRSQPEIVNSIEVHPGQELQMIIVTQASPAYFRENDILHSANGTNEGFTAIERYRIWGRPLEKVRDLTDLSLLPTDKPLFINDIFDNPLFFGSSDISLNSYKQEVLPVTVNGQTVFTLSARPLQPGFVQAYARGIKLTYGVDYVVSGTTNQTLTYIVSGSNPALVTTDTLEVFYPLF